MRSTGGVKVPGLAGDQQIIDVDHECIDEYDVGELRRYIRRTFSEICRMYTV